MKGRAAPPHDVDRPIRRPELTELETFIIAARDGSLAAAARRLRISTPAVAKRIASLEAIVGLPLLERSRNGVRLTDEGRQLVPRVEQLLEMSDDLLERVAAARRGDDPLRIGGVHELLGGRRAPSTEAVLSETEALLAQLFHLGSSGIVVARPADLHLYDVNDAFCAMLGYRREQLVGRPAPELWADPAAQEQLLAALRETGGVVRDLPAALVARDGTPRLVEVSAFLLPVGGEHRLLATVRDVTDRAAAEQRTARHVHRAQAVADLGLMALRGATLDELYERATVVANDELGGFYATIAEYDPKRNVLLRRAMHGQPELDRGSLPVELAPDPSLLLGPDEAFIVADFRRRRDLNIGTARRLGLRSSIVAIMRGRDAPFGVLSVQSLQPNAFTDDDLGFVRSLANTLATVIERIEGDAVVGRLEAGLADIVRSSQDAILSASLDGVILTWNEAAERMFGYTAAEAIGNSLALFMPPSRLDEPTELLGLIAAGEHVDHFRTQRVRQDGAVLDVSLSISPVRDRTGRVIGASAIVRDLTHQLRLEAELQRMQRLHTAVVESTRSGVLVIGLDATIVFANRAMHSLLGFAAGELLGRSIADFERDAPEALVRAQIARNGHGNADRYETTLRCKDGSEVPVSISAAPFLLDDGSFGGSVELVDDISERLHQEAELARSYRLMETAQMVAKLGTVVWDTQVATAAMSSGAMRILGLGDAPGELSIDDMLMLAHPDDRADLQQGLAAVIAADTPFESTFRIVRGDGELRWLQHHSVPFVDEHGRRLRLGVLQDVTEQRARQEQLRRAARMEAVARMAGGVAHDFNNIVTGVVGYAQLTLARLPAGDPARTYLSEVLRGTDEAAALVSQFTTFGRDEQIDVRPIDLNAAIREIGRLLDIVLGARVHLELRLAPELPAVEANLGALEQVVMNVAVNAMDAMPAGGRFAIETAYAELDESYAAAHADVTPGRYVLLTMADNGTGMDAETQQHAFEPFFTTKAAEGTGLGLASVYGIVQRLGGYVWLYSEPGLGTTIKLYLPALAAAQEQEWPGTPADLVAGGSETILLAEDDEAIRTLAARVLGAKGYRVLAAASGEEALALADQEPDAIDMLITDVVMSGMSGQELAERLRAERPSIATLITSGYAEVPNAGDARIVPKPYGPLELAQHVRTVLDAPVPAARAGTES